MGVALLVTYGTVMLASTRLGSHPVRPLFDGVGPPPAYQWVNPPATFKNDNVVPRPGNATIDFTAGRSESAALQTPDGQFVVDVPAGAVPPNGADTVVAATITPLDAGTLGRLPAPLRNTGNAYRIELSYSPSKQEVGLFTPAADLFLTVPEASEVVLYSPDGREWQHLDTTHLIAGVTGISVGAQFSRPGWYLGATSTPAPTALAPAGSGSRSWVVTTMVILAAIGIIVVLGKWVWWRKRRWR